MVSSSAHRWCFPYLAGLAVLHAGVAQDSPCGALLHEDVAATGQQFLDGCAAPAVAAVEAAIGGATQAELHPGFSGCVVLSERLIWQAFENGPACSCPEACPLVLVLQALALDFDSTALCSQTLFMLIRAYRYLEGITPEHIQGVDANLRMLIDARRRHCAATRERELQEVGLPFTSLASAAGYAREVGSTPDSTQGGGTAPARAASEQVAVLVAGTPNMLRVYQPFINLWRCYALRHGLAFLLETDDTEVSAPHHRAPNWMRWFAARRHLSFYRALLVVDPDQFVVPECWNVSIPAVLGAWVGAGLGPGSEGTRQVAPDVALRDFGRPQTLNNGVVLIRNSPRGAFFLEQMLEKAAWMQTIEHDQGAFDETVLELLGLEAIARGEEGYDSECTQYVFPNARGNHEVALYAMCWWGASERLAGPFGARRSGVVRFVDPRLADVNHVVGARGVAEPAVLHHFAGRSKDWDEMLEHFGMSRRGTADCRQVFEHVDAAAGKHACTPGAPLAECEWPTLVC